MSNNNNIETHPTGEGSPVSEVRVANVSGLTQEQISENINKIPVPEGHVRLYRGITSEYSPNTGSNCFSPDLNTSLDYSGNGKDARLVFIDVSTETLNDWRAYEKLSAAIGASYNVLGKISGSVIDIPLGWTNGEKPNAEILRDMNGLGKKLSTINEYVLETTLNIYTEKRNLENNIATKYYQEHGRDARPDWDQMFRDNPEHQKTRAKLNEIWNYEQKELKEIAQQLPTLRDAPKITNKSNEDIKSGKHGGKIGVIISGVIAGVASLFSSDNAEANTGKIKAAKDAAGNAILDGTPIVGSVKAIQEGKGYEEAATRVLDNIGAKGILALGDVSRFLSRAGSLITGTQSTVDPSSIEMADWAKYLAQKGVAFTDEMQDFIKQQIVDTAKKDGKPIDPEHQKILDQIFVEAKQKINMEKARETANQKPCPALECKEVDTSTKAPPPVAGEKQEKKAAVG